MSPRPAGRQQPAGGPTGAGSGSPVGADVVVVGAGAIGLSIAWRAAASGMSVAVVDPEAAQGASFAAAGMLAPVGEALWGEERLLRLNLSSASLWPGFAAELEDYAGTCVGFRTCGSLLVGLDGSDRAQLEDLYRFQQHLGLEVEWCNAAASRELEPLLSPAIRCGILAAGDHQVDTRRLLEALLVACRRAGVAFVDERVERIEVGSRGAEGVVLGEGGHIGAGAVVLAAGCRSATVAGVPAEALPAVRPVKGQILRLRGGTEPPVLSRSLRCVVGGRSCYLVPRVDGRIVLGSTTEERGFDTSVTAGAVYELLREAQRALPVVAELELLEARAGLRPGSPDNAPIVGPSRVDGLVLATGHGRNGILLTPLTADLVATALRGERLPELASDCSPSRPGATLG